MRKNYTITKYLAEFWPQALRDWQDYQVISKRERARTNMRARYVPTGRNPGRPRIKG